jgi:hypothetical protein
MFLDGRFVLDEESPPLREKLKSTLVAEKRNLKNEVTADHLGIAGLATHVQS